MANPCVFFLLFIAIPYIDQNSYSNSNNGGSVDSQDSLWKAPSIVPNEQQQQQHVQMQQQQSQSNQQIQQQPQYNHSSIMQSGHRNSNYEHQPYSDDYVPYENRNSNYMSDPYGPIPKPKRRLDLIGEYYASNFFCVLVNFGFGIEE